MLQFTLDLVTNVDVVDEQHQEIFRRINEMSDMGAKLFTDEEVQSTLDFLGAYVIEHFKAEEDLMIKWDYPKYDHHKGEHEKFLEEFTRFRGDFSKMGSTVSYTLSLVEHIVNWIVTHIKQSDKDMAKHINEQMQK